MTVKELATKILEEIGYSPYAIAEHEKDHILNSAYGKFQEPTAAMLEVIRNTEECGGVRVFAIMESTPLKQDVKDSSEYDESAEAFYRGLTRGLPDSNTVLEQMRNEHLFETMGGHAAVDLRTAEIKRDPSWVPHSVSYLAVCEEEARIAQENEDAGRPLLEGIVDVEEDDVYGFYADVEDSFCATDYVTLTVRKGVLCLVD